MALGMNQPTGQRRLAALLVADVAGYSRLMEQDEIGTIETLKGRRKTVLEPAVRAHDRRIVKFMGDGVLVEFASAISAVRCAIALQAGMAAANVDTPANRRIELRIGINLGDIIGDGGDVYGEGVNIGARLEALATTGGIVISGKIHEEVSGKVHFAAEDLGHVALKNISRPVRAWRVTGGEAPKPAAHSTATRFELPAIAVLPFVNMSHDPEQEHLADGLTEDIITALSRFANLAVISRTTVFTFKGKTSDIKRIAAELDVDYILEGSIRRTGNRVRITAQLIDSASGHHIWAEKFDGPLGEILDFQDNITRSISASTQTHIVVADWKAPRAVEQLDSKAYLLARRALGRLYDMTPEACTDGEQLAEEALQLDPTCALALRARANAFVIRLGTGNIPHSEENMRRGIELSEQALKASPRDEWTHWLMAFALTEAGRIDEALIECDLGLEINPNASMILGDKGDILAMLGRPQEAIEACELAIRLNPRDPIRYWWENSIASAHYLMGDYPAARNEAKRVARRKPDHIRAAIIWAAAAAAMGEEADARQAVDHCLAQNSRIRLSTVMPDFIPIFKQPEHSTMLLDHLRQAGLPS